jgi:2-polyprenyl-3-methyl-5-hydroxy-6-metoxy-1,4-benzoquinol methylase
MIRNCPVCYSPRFILVREMKFASGDIQKVVACRDCGLGYASESTPADYSNQATYTMPESIGAGGTPEDRSRLKGFVENFSKVVVDRKARILDIGCGQAGLLDALRECGYVNAQGLDPSAECVRIAQGKDHKVFHGSIPGWVGNPAEVVILNHVLEHVWNVNDFLAAVHSLITPQGMIFLEVPNAEQYADFVFCPFLDFNHEHINHFTQGTLDYTMACNNFQVKSHGKRTFTLPGGNYPALWCVAQPVMPEKPLIYKSLSQYGDKSEENLNGMAAQYREKIAGRGVCVWGAGEFAEVFIPALIKKGVSVIQIVDRNPAKHGHVLSGVTVTPPPPHPVLPVVVASVLNLPSILRDLQKYPNEVITL